MVLLFAKEEVEIKEQYLVDVVIPHAKDDDDDDDDWDLDADEDVDELEELGDLDDWGKVTEGDENGDW